MSDPYELVERTIEQIIQQQASSDGVHFFLQVGGRYDDRGIVTLQISGSGWAFVSKRDDDSVFTYSARLPKPYLFKVYSFLLHNPFWRVRVIRRKRLVKVNEANIHIRLSDQNKGVCNACQCWTTDLAASSTLSTVLNYLNELIRILSDGDVELDLSSQPIPSDTSTRPSN